jgi:crotonobetainyl-CoA:carnitine CoA-transferase CaiB-like acyl-CoA transferase
VTSEDLAFEIAEAYRTSRAEKTKGMVRVIDLAKELGGRHPTTLTRKLRNAGATIFHIEEPGQAGVSYVTAEEARRILVG